ncbi:glycosyltransferase family 2 protein [uncultured Paraglaciecola sp.]|uniref:glycosyltransferase family 2 protein n=1 Tax=uncultured Paraglaciecola sp. TaxID=1765024 RepID=UPI00260D8494|nr:glycosyltransferase family 2 protein [uncultured Paraglaciecola sp.]
MSYCFIIPNYNHTQAVANTIAALQHYALPIILVDDGSNLETQTLLEELAAEYQNLTLFRRSINGGKGAAVKTGLTIAYEMDMSHAIQVDADGQHNLADIDSLLNESKRYPLAMISGRPLYDESISKGRYYGRFITHFWVYIETLSFTIKDSMCGFRVYPLKACMQLMDKQALGDRMDFDIEIMVRLFWQNTAIRFIATKVLYPPDGVSHFNVWKDNWLISKMHTRLFFGMIIRLPYLLFSKFRGQ